MTPRDDSTLRSRSATFTLVAKDAASGQLGIATASRFLAVGAVVPFLRPGVGAVATQHHHEPRLAIEVLDELEAGVEPRDAVQRALKFFGHAERRQVAVLMAAPQEGQQGAYAYTGDACQAYASQLVSDDLIVLGNTLAGEEVLAAAERGFRQSNSPHLAERLLEGLLAADRAGGDARGKQAAAIKVAGSQAFQPASVDLRVDDHPDAPSELHRIFILHCQLSRGG
ncbi:MAG: DUF1028 domain-containing protein [Planctomycetota bacterium]|nr:DUF1028 domain-containing protein [Planctomycetota bacterium]